MKQIDLLYENLMLLLDYVTISDEFDVFYAILNPTDQDKLIDIVEKVAIEKEEILQSYDANEFYSDFTPLVNVILDFKTFFNAFPNHRINEILAIIHIIEKLRNELGGRINLEDTITPTEFEIISLDNSSINKDVFFVFNTLDTLESLLLFNIDKIEVFKTYILNISAGSHLLFYLLKHIGRTGHPIRGKHVLVKSVFASQPKLVLATLGLNIVITGETIHKSYEYIAPPTLAPNANVKLGEKYQQFYDSIDIISEYNYQKDILDKYLRIYHVLENFMYKAALVALEKDAGGQIFSVRDFKRMYDNINDSEHNMLKKLFEEILNLEYSPGTTFKTKIITEWNSLIPHHFPDDTKINSLLKILNVKTTKGGDIDFSYITNPINPLHHSLSKLIYMLRNSIVHNRETEFHLTHLKLLSHPTLDDTAKTILETFLLPRLEEIVFSLITTKNDLVWYDNSVLKLWEEN